MVVTIRGAGHGAGTDVLSVEVVEHIGGTIGSVIAGRVGALAVDMSIGLPTAGPRAADRAARRLLGPRRSSVFPTPCRSVLPATDYADACARSREASGKALSKQAWNLVPKLAELDALVDPSMQQQVVEAHPEVAFAVLAGDALPPKRTPEGLARRRDCLEAALPGIERHVDAPPRGAGRDDVLDAAVIALVARAVMTGTAVRLGDGSRDARGLTMEIVTLPSS